MTGGLLLVALAATYAALLVRVRRRYRPRDVRPPFTPPSHVRTYHAPPTDLAPRRPDA